MGPDDHLGLVDPLQIPSCQDLGRRADGEERSFGKQSDAVGVEPRQIQIVQADDDRQAFAGEVPDKVSDRKSYNPTSSESSTASRKISLHSCAA